MARFVGKYITSGPLFMGIRLNRSGSFIKNLNEIDIEGNNAAKRFLSNEADENLPKFKIQAADHLQSNTSDQLNSGSTTSFDKEASKLRTSSSSFDPIQISETKIQSPKTNRKKTEEGRKSNLVKRPKRSLGKVKEESANNLPQKYPKQKIFFKDVLSKFNTQLGHDELGDEGANKAFDKAAKFYEDKREAELYSKKRTPEYSIDWESAMAMVKETESRYPSRSINREELESLPMNQPTFNIAKIVSESPSLQQMIDLGVDLSEWEEKDSNGKNIEIALRINFEHDVKPRIQFMINQGIDLEYHASIFTSNPSIFDVSLESLNQSIEYLKSKDFSPRNIQDILIGSYGRWFNFSSEIDKKLGYFQKNFELSGEEVRQIAVAAPNLVIWGGVPYQINLNHITIVDRMGFTKNEAKEILLRCPNLYKSRFEDKLQLQFEMAHHTIGLSHQTIVQHPYILLKNRLVLRDRHLFLKKLGRDQYDPAKPNFVSPETLCEDEDSEFCSRSAKVPVEYYNKFLLST